MKRFALVLLLSMALVGCDDGDNGGQSYAAPQAYPTPMPYGEPLVRDFAAEQVEQDRFVMSMWDAVMQADTAVERRDAIR